MNLKIKDLLLQQIDKDLNIYNTKFFKKDYEVGNKVFYLGLCETNICYTPYSINKISKTKIYYKESDYYYNVYIDWERPDGTILTKNVKIRKEKLNNKIKTAEYKDYSPRWIFYSFIDDIRYVIDNFGYRDEREWMKKHEEIYDPVDYYIKPNK